MELPVEQRREWIRNRRAQRKLTRRARLRRQILRYLLLTLLFAGGVSGFYYNPWLLADSNQQILIRGNKVVTDEQIKGMLTDAVTTPLYRLDPKVLESKVMQLGLVKQAFVRRYALPHPKLVVEIMEEFPWASFGTDPSEEPQSVICESGKLISIAEFPRVFQPPLTIYGPQALRLTSADVGQWASWINLIERQTKVRVDSVDMRNPLDVKVRDGDLSLKLGAPDTTLSKRIARLASVQAAIQPARQEVEYIDLGLDNNIPVKVAKKSEKSGRSIHSQL